MHRVHDLLFPRFPKLNQLMIFSVPLFFIFFVENVVGFIFPIVIDEQIKSVFLTGAILSLASFAGIVLDFLLPIFLKGRSWKFQFLSASIIAIFFPVFVALGRGWSLIAFFYLASVAWGIYYELLMFSQQNFVVSEEPVRNYSRDWGIIYLIRSVSAIISPIFGALLLERSSFQMGTVLVLLQVIGIAFFVMGMAKLPKNYHPRKSQIYHTINVIKKYFVWRTFLTRFLPVLVMGVLVGLIDATYSTMGGLFGQTLTTTALEWLPVVLYCIPWVFGSLLLSKYPLLHRKKFWSQICLLVGGALLIPFYVLNGSLLVIFGLILISSFILSFCSPLNDAVYCDLQDRAGEFDQDLVGVSKLNNTLAFMFGPILMGFLADQVGFLGMFSVLGVLLVVSATLLIIFTPKKLHFPHQELEEITGA